MHIPPYQPRSRPVTEPGMATILDAFAEHIDVHLDVQNAFAYRTHWEPASDRAPYPWEQGRVLRQWGPGGDWTTENIDRALTFGTLGLSVSGHLLEGVLSCLRSRDVLFPLAPMIRSIVERCGLVGWILYTGQNTPTWSIRDRVARLLLAEISDMKYHLSAAKVLSPPKEIQQLSKQLANRKASIGLLFWPSEITKREGRESLIRGTQLPSISEFNHHIGAGIGLDWNHEGIYRVLSNLTHPTYAPLRPLLGARDPVDGPLWSLDDPTYFRSVRAALLAYSYTWEMLATYLGYSHGEIRQLREAFDDDPRLKGL